MYSLIRANSSIGFEEMKPNMSEIKINKKSEEENKWIFEIGVEGLDFLVEVEKDYWRALTSGKIEPEELVKKSFEFLLAREPKEFILRSFNLRVISNYFPEYEGEIGKNLIFEKHEKT